MICGACGSPWTGEKCGQAENDHPFPVCYAFDDEGERLRAALDHITRVALGSSSGADGGPSKRNQWIAYRAISALNGDENWRSAPKPRDYHQALESDYGALPPDS